MTTLAEVVESATQALRDAFVPSPQVDAEILVAHVLGVSRGEMLSWLLQGKGLSAVQLEQCEALVYRRSTREPLQHLVGVAPFLDFELTVGPGVFVPRPETESLAIRAITHASGVGVGDQGILCVDLCAGSGTLAIALARAVAYARVRAVEVSAEALPYLQENVRRLAPSVEVVQASVAEFGDACEADSVDVLLANPPYVPEAEVPNDPEVSQWDPPLALYGGEDGLDILREIVTLGIRVLKSGGALMVEHSNLHGDAVRSLMRDAGYRRVETERDLTGRDRFTTGFKP